jgi:hypothetical protein
MMHSLFTLAINLSVFFSHDTPLGITESIFKGKNPQSATCLVEPWSRSLPYNLVIQALMVWGFILELSDTGPYDLGLYPRT